MERSELPLNGQTLEELERLGSERRPIASRLERLTALRAEVSDAVFGRVRGDYERRVAEIDRRAAPLAREGKRTVATIEAALERLENERRGLELDLQELALRHSLAELSDEELAERNRTPRERMAAIAGEAERATASRERWIAAIGQGFAAVVDVAPSAPAAPPPPAAAASPAPAAPAEETKRVDITVPHPIPPPRPSSPAVPLPGPAAVEAAARTAYVAPVAPSLSANPSAATPAPARTAYVTPAPPMPPVPPDRTVVLGSVPPPAVPKARLVAVDVAGAAAQEHSLTAENTLGRVSENSIPVPHGSVSRHHATLRYANGAWWILDQKSENGTWVNGERVSERQLAHDDRINIGTVRFRLKLD